MAVLIGRGLDHIYLMEADALSLPLLWSVSILPLLSIIQFFIQFSGYLNTKTVFKRKQRLKNAPLAQLVEHLTLNQGVPGSSP